MAFSKVILNGTTLMDVTQKTVTSASMLSGTTALKNDGTDVTGTIVSKSSSDVTKSGLNVSAPAGYYSSDVSVTIPVAEALNITESTDTSGGTLINVTGVDLSADTVDAAHMETGYTAHDANGNAITGAYQEQPVKYIYTDTDGDDAWNVSGYAKTSVDYGDLADNKFRLWIETTQANTEFTVTVKTGGKLATHYVWGDGNEEDKTIIPTASAATVIGDSYSTNVSHTYSNAGRYVLEISSASNLIGGLDCQNNAYIKGVEIASYIDKWYSTHFSGCTALERITYPALLTDVTTNTSIFSIRECTSLKKAIFRSTSSSIPTFQGCTSLEEFTFPSTLGVVAGDTFSGCTSLRKVNNLENKTITTLKQNMFKNCTSLHEIALPSTLTGFEENGSFEGSGIQKITIPSGVTSMGRYTFQDCASLMEVHMLPTVPPTLYAYSYSAFRGTSPNMVIYVPNGYLSTYQSATNWSTYASQMVEEAAT